MTTTTNEAASPWTLHKSLLNTTGTVIQLNIPMGGPGGAVGFPKIECKILEDLGASLLIEHKPRPGKPVITEQLPKSQVFSVQRESSVLA